ncbi:protein THYLAKOID ASSEMBLY 8, chloroplastic-like [Phoenix dactylifera]|uniref:Protein THYLAKOID ASSEMBLY 8, chloroplastic-like n=1 Tax=Phoenix dactylifera TaxID=42345 RepID=A0A8B7BLD8_PHODC|nr:protein THYLAKOID ASSEMBLY 8, chloroplastic-like [Phoenix dactylifera]
MSSGAVPPCSLDTHLVPGVTAGIHEHSMASTALLNPAFAIRPSPSLLRLPKPHATLIFCGPRDNRGPLRRGRTLSSEAILAIQALKRARGDEHKVEHIVSTTLSRLIKADLLAALAELQRQDQWRLALTVFAAAGREPWYKPDFSLYAAMVSTLARCGVAEEIDVLVSNLLKEKEMEGGISLEDIRGLTQLSKALVAAGRGKVLRDIYREIKRGGCDPDEYLFKLMIRGLRRLGEGEAADEVEKDYERWFEGGALTQPLPV